MTTLELLRLQSSLVLPVLPPLLPLFQLMLAS